MTDVVEEKLGTEKWLVDLTKEERSVYMRLRQVELDWLESAKRKGCKLLHGSSRHVAVIVPDGVQLPSFSSLMLVTNEWHTILSNASSAQGKEMTIGERSAKLPVWIGIDGKSDIAITSAKPSYLAKRITFRKHRAYRGARLAPGDVIIHLQNRIANYESYIANSYANKNKKRAAGQEAYLKELMDAFVAVRKLVDDGDVVSARLCSGEAFKIHVRGDGFSYSSALATIGLIPAARDVHVAPAPHRDQRETSDDEVMYVANLELTIKRKVTA